MRIHVLSDLHLGFSRLLPASVVADALVLAGDITDGNRDRLFEFVGNYLKKNLPVLFVPGNHEFYGHSIAAELLALWRACRRQGVELLHNRVVVIDGVRFAGTTLWTDLALYGAPELLSVAVRQAVADFTYITHRRARLRPEATRRFHQRALRFLERVFGTPHNGSTVVVTHHGAHPRSIHARFALHPLNPAFVSNLDEQIRRWRPAYWIHGHVHNRFDYRIGDTRVIANPRGYVCTRTLPDGSVVVRREHDEFDPNLVIEV